jgi:hypothetical protein
VWQILYPCGETWIDCDGFEKQDMVLSNHRFGAAETDKGRTRTSGYGTNAGVDYPQLQSNQADCTDRC